MLHILQLIAAVFLYLNYARLPVNNSVQVIEPKGIIILVSLLIMAFLIGIFYYQFKMKKINKNGFNY